MRKIPINALVGDVVEWSEKLFYGTLIHFRSGRELVVADLIGLHQATAWEPNT